VDALAAGTYAIRIASPNFMPFQRDALVVSAGGIQTLNVRLEIQGQTSKVTVSENAGLSVDPSQNAGQLVLKGSDLDSLSDDAEDLSNELQMLAGTRGGSGRRPNLHRWFQRWPYAFQAGSPFFGRSIALNTFGPLPGAGPNAGAGNRHIELKLRLTF
jgi:hypothetical protein